MSINLATGNHCFKIEKKAGFPIFRYFKWYTLVSDVGTSLEVTP